MAFGFDDKELARAKRRREAPSHRKLFVGVGSGVVVLLVLGTVLGLAMLGSQSGMRRMVHAIAGQEGVQVGFDQVVVDKSVGVLHPMMWQATFKNVAAQAGSAPTPTVQADAVTVSVGDLFRAWRGAVPRLFGDVTIQGLKIQVPVQSPVPAPGKAGVTWIVHHLTIKKGHTIDIAADPPRPAAKINDFSAAFEDLRYTEGSHAISGKGRGHIEGFTDAGTTATGIDLASIVAREDTFGISGTAKLFGVDAKVVAQIKQLQEKGALEMSIDLQPVPVQEVLTQALGAPDLLHGGFEGKILVKAGGDRARGDAEVALDGNVANPQLAVGSADSAKALLHLVPTLRSVDDDPKSVALPDLTGRISRTAQGIEIERLVFDGPVQTRLRGILAPDSQIVVRTVPQLDYWQKPGRGAVLTKSDKGWDVRLGTTEELMPPKPPAPAPGAPKTPPAPAPGG